MAIFAWDFSQLQYDSCCGWSHQPVLGVQDDLFTHRSGALNALPRGFSLQLSSLDFLHGSSGLQETALAWHRFCHILLVKAVKGQLRFKRMEWHAVQRGKELMAPSLETRHCSSYPALGLSPRDAQRSLVPGPADSLLVNCFSSFNSELKNHSPQDA